jgi:hypothetical protein
VPLELGLADLVAWWRRESQVTDKTAAAACPL